MNLYEINGKIAQLSEMLSEGEIDEEIYQDTLENLGGAVAVEEVIKAIKNKQGEAELFEAEADKFTEKKKKAEKAVDSLKKMLLTYLNNTGKKKEQTTLFTVSKGCSKSANITDESLIPAEYLIEQPAKIDKKAILAALKAGESIQGAEIKESEFITIK